MRKLQYDDSLRLYLDKFSRDIKLLRNESSSNYFSLNTSLNNLKGEVIDMQNYVRDWFSMQEECNKSIFASLERIEHNIDDLITYPNHLSNFPDRQGVEVKSTDDVKTDINTFPSHGEIARDISKIPIGPVLPEPKQYGGLLST